MGIKNIVLAEFTNSLVLVEFVNSRLAVEFGGFLLRPTMKLVGPLWTTSTVDESNELLKHMY